MARELYGNDTKWLVLNPYINMREQEAILHLKSYGYTEKDSDWYRLLGLLMSIKLPTMRDHVGHKWCTYPSAACTCLPMSETKGSE